MAIKIPPWLQGWLGSRSKGPAKRPEGGFITQHRKDVPEVPEPWDPRYVDQHSEHLFPALFQGRALGYHAQGMGVAVPTVLPRGRWTVAVHVNGVSKHRREKVTGSGGDTIQINLQPLDILKIHIKDEWENTTMIRGESQKRMRLTIAFVEAGNERRIQLPYEGRE